MEVIITNRAKRDLDYWKKTGNLDVLKKIRFLVEAIKESPFSGIGKPEPLKFEFAGNWSRRINHEHRIIYTVREFEIIILSLKGHYNN